MTKRSSPPKVGETRRDDGRPCRIALVHPAAGVNWSGGAETFAIELSRYLSNYFEVELLSGTHCSPLSYPVYSIPYNHTYELMRPPLIKPLWSNFIKSPEIWLEHFSGFLPCALHLLRKPVDLIFPCNEWGGLAMASTVRSLIQTPILYTEHGSLIEDGYHLLRNMRFRPDHLVVFSEVVSRFVHEVQTEQAVSIIPNGVDLKRFTLLGESMDLGLPKPIVLCVSSLERTGYKRSELVIHAMKYLPHASLLICGNGPDRDYYQALGDDLLGPERFAIQTFPFEKMPIVYRSSDIFTLASVDEPFALSYLEAMASGLPIVTTKDEIRRHIVGEAGVVCNVTNAEIYAEALNTVLSKRSEIQARNNALRFSWDTMALRYREVIEKTIGKS